MQKMQMLIQATQYTQTPQDKDVKKTLCIVCDQTTHHMKIFLSVISSCRQLIIRQSFLNSRPH